MVDLAPVIPAHNSGDAEGCVGAEQLDLLEGVHHVPMAKLMEASSHTLHKGCTKKHTHRYT